ncbi:hypothetical protein HUJ04_005907 [Dendroctonus ponderosae]|uniref:Peroxisomal membrane protein PEX13 n=2 Tax=Dendroctonus ponderosae TaxID=77166 RepID=A0AAR5PMS0_DENPD|nr:hypothetical protein HUJ04_005907 [Dendroctonus ponderosae]
MNKMSTPWEPALALQNTAQFLRNQNMGAPFISGRAPVLPPRPLPPGSNSYSLPYGLSSYNSPYGSFGGYGASPYRGALYGSSYGAGYSNYNSMYQNPDYSGDDHERRFIQYAEENSRQTFASVENVVRAFNSLAMMLDNTFFAMTSSFRAILGVAENFGRLRSMFGHIWYSVNVFRFITWMYRKLRIMLGLKAPKSASSLAWKEAGYGAGSAAASPPPSGSSWPTLAFLGVIVSAPYLISRFLPKYEDKLDPANWKSPGIKAKACFDFVATSPNELTIHTNDNILLAPTHIQEEMNLKNSGWAYGVHNGKFGMIPLNYIVISKNNKAVPETVPIPRISNIKDANGPVKTHSKRVSFGDIEIFENDENLIRKEKLPDESADSCSTEKPGAV